MGRIPHDLVKVGLPNMMGGIIEHGIPDPQILFLGIGDHMIHHLYKSVSLNLVMQN
jgi:hypothetical protein